LAGDGWKQPLPNLENPSSFRCKDDGDLRPDDGRPEENSHGKTGKEDCKHKGRSQSGGDEGRNCLEAGEIYIALLT